MTVTVGSLRDAAVHEALDRARGHLLSLQHADGWWKGELETNVTIDSEDLFLRRYLGTRGCARDGGDGPLDPREAARGRHLGDLLRRCRRPLDDRRGVRGAAARGRPVRRGAHAARGRVRARRGRDRADARVHANVAVAALALAVGGGAGDPARADPAPAARTALDLLVRLLGAADDRRALGRLGAAAGRRRCRSGSTSCGRAQGRSRRPTPGAARSASSTGDSTATSDARSARSGGARCGRRSAGSSSARSATARGAASSRRGSGR